MAEGREPTLEDALLKLEQLKGSIENTNFALDDIHYMLDQDIHGSAPKEAILKARVTHARTKLRKDQL